MAYHSQQLNIPENISISFQSCHEQGLSISITASGSTIHITSRKSAVHLLKVSHVITHE